MTYPPNPPGPPNEPEGGYPGYSPQQYPGAAQYPPPGTPPYGPAARSRRTPVLVGVAIVVLAAIGVGVYFAFLRGTGGYDTPAKAADALMKAAQARDMDGVKNALCAGDQALASQFTTQDSGGTLKSYSIGTTTQKDGTHASVHVDVVTSQGKDGTDLPVTKESDGWLVCVSDLLKELPTSIPTG